MPVFDGARLGLGTDGVRVDLLAFAPVDVHRNRPNRRRNGENLYGAYGSMTKLLPNTTIEPYLFWKTLEDVTATTQQPGHANVYTSGMRWATELPSGPEFSAEWARQTGNRSTDKISAWYGYGYGGYRFKKYKDTSRTSGRSMGMQLEMRRGAGPTAPSTICILARRVSWVSPT